MSTERNRWHILETYKQVFHTYSGLFIDFLSRLILVWLLLRLLVASLSDNIQQDSRDLTSLTSSSDSLPNSTGLDDTALSTRSKSRKRRGVKSPKQLSKLRWWWLENLQVQAWVLLVDALCGDCLSREANEGLHQAGYLSFRARSATSQKGFLC